MLLYQLFIKIDVLYQIYVLYQLFISNLCIVLIIYIKSITCIKSVLYQLLICKTYVLYQIDETRDETK